MITHDEARKKPKYYSTTEKLIDSDFYYDYITQQEKKEELLGLYRKKEQCIVCVPIMKDSTILHCVVRYSDDEKYMRILSQIKQLEEEMKLHRKKR